jgi:thioredoxin-related protein
MKKNIILFIFFGSVALFSQTEKTVLKTFTFEEVETLHKKKPKPIVVFIYTDWCKICHGMKKTTFENTKVIKLLNNNFYFVKLNAESKKSITFLGKTFTYKPTGTNIGLHELANELANKKDRLAYPTTTILNSKFEIDLQLIGYRKSKKMITILNKMVNLK